MPAGIYDATLNEVAVVFALDPWRAWLFEGLRLALADLASAGCSMAYLDGSFVTAKSVPGDFDLCWDMVGVDLAALHPALRDVAHPRTAQKARYRGDILPNVVELRSGMPFLDFFQIDRDTGSRKGIVRLELKTATP